MSGYVSYYLHECKGYVDCIGPAIKDWYESCQRPGEFQKRARAMIPSTLVECVALAIFPTSASVGMIAAAVMPEAIDRIMHCVLVQEMNSEINKLNLTSTQKKTVTVAGILMSGLIQDSYLTILPSLLIAKHMAEATFRRYYSSTPKDSEVITKSYRPSSSKQVEKSPEDILRFYVKDMHRIYNKRAENLESLIKCINDIVQQTIGDSDERSKIELGYQESMQIFQRKDGPWCIYSESASAHAIIKNPKNFNGINLNHEMVDQEIANIKRKALESRSAAELFVTIHATDAFQAHPIKYIESWREARTDPSIVEKKVLKHLDSRSGCTVLPYNLPSLKKKGKI